MEDTVLAIAPFPDAVRYLVAWGDGTVVEVVDVDEPLHQFYLDGGEHQVQATAVLADGTTWSSVSILDVGGTPPEDLKWLQEAFAPENQDMTWGILGLIVAFLGGVGAVAARAWRRRGIATHLQRLDHIRGVAADELMQALLLLRRFRLDIRAQAKRGRLDGAQFASLVAEARHVADHLRVQLLGVLETRMSERMRHALDLALADGHLSVGERTSLQKAVAREKRLDAAQKDDFRALLADWV